jgi:cytochrome bd-type quinol oxidase subunit 1
MRDMMKKAIITAMSSGPLVSVAGAMMGEASYCQVEYCQKTKAKAVEIRALPCW